MWKKIIQWLLKEIMIPMIKEFSGELVRLLIREAQRVLRGLLDKWKERDLQTAPDEKTRNKIETQYMERREDLVSAFAEIEQKIPEIVKIAIDQAERDRLPALEKGFEEDHPHLPHGSGEEPKEDH